ncbi:MAG: M4 family metallopeptidase, partial [Bradyrhizobium sp.]
PGSAFKDHPVLGTDPQPDNMDNFVDMSEEDDFGGVHINSGIPNKAFYVTASQIGGFAWEAPGQIWYASLLASTTTTNFQQFADITYLKSGELYGQQSKEQAAVLSAWDEVGIRISGAVTLAGTARRLTTAPFPTAVNGNGRTEDEAVTMMREIDSLAKQLSKLTKEVNTLKKPH